MHHRSPYEWISARNFFWGNTHELGELCGVGHHRNQKWIIMCLNATDCYASSIIGFKNPIMFYLYASSGGKHIEQIYGITKPRDFVSISLLFF